MIKSVMLCVAILISTIAFSQVKDELYLKTFGEKANQAIIFLHGGPGYNSATFEVTTAQALADNGFFVIVYDRRGEGRSAEAKAAYTFAETFSDLDQIYQTWDLEKASLIGHSFGGIVATLYAKEHPKKVNSIVLVGAPVSLQETFRTIIKTSTKIYTEKKDATNLNYMQMLIEMDASSLEYSSYCFMHAMQNGFYSPKEPTEEATSIYQLFKSNETLQKHASDMSFQAPRGFWKNEQYTTLDLSKDLKFVMKKKVKVFGIYGKEDGLYSQQQVADIEKIIHSKNFAYLDNCSHSVFIDQQSQFIAYLVDWIP